jgi:hypothetical protein
MHFDSSARRISTPVLAYHCANNIFTLCFIRSCQRTEQVAVAEIFYTWIRKVSGSNLGPDTDYNDWGSSEVSLVTSSKQNECLTSGHSRSLPGTFHFIIQHHPAINSASLQAKAAPFQMPPNSSHSIILPTTVPRFRPQPLPSRCLPIHQPASSCHGQCLASGHGRSIPDTSNSSFSTILPSTIYVVCPKSIQPINIKKKSNRHSTMVP